MEAFSAESLTATLALIGIVIMVSAWLSGLIERSGLPQVGVFLALGAILGPAGLGVLHLSLDSPILRVVATLSLALVLFTDAVSLNIPSVIRQKMLALRVLGPGTFLTTAIIAFAGWYLLKLPVAAAAILGAALASTDPVLLRGLLRRRDIPSDARHALQLESGLNDVVVLPVVIVAMVFLHPGESLDGLGWAKLGVNLFLLGPGAGILVGLMAVSALDLIRRRIGVRRDYESLYSLGVAFTAFAAAESVHGSGFLAVFAAGMTISALDVELCDCFVEYGEVTAEMLLLFTFVLFGSSLIWSGLTVIDAATLLFAAIALLTRLPVFLLSLAGSKVDKRSRLLISWFGPRGLSSLLLILLPVFEDAPGSDHLFALCSLVVLASIVLHGGSPLLLDRMARKRAGKQDIHESHSEDVPPPDSTVELPEEKRAAAPVSSNVSAEEVKSNSVAIPLNLSIDGHVNSKALQIGPQRVTLEEVVQLWQANEPVTILDVRQDRSLEKSDQQAQHAVRLPPNHIAERARELGLRKDHWLLAYCT